MGAGAWSARIHRRAERRLSHLPRKFVRRPVVSIQEGHRVIDTGIHAYVGHPMYAGALLYLIGLPLMLGSWRGLTLTPFLILAIAWRAVNAEKTLRAELPDYTDYATRVRYRFVPGVW